MIGREIWVAGLPANRRPRRRAARYQGFFPVNLERADELAEIVADVTRLRREARKDPTEAFDFVASLAAGVDPTPYIAAGATWHLVEFSADEAIVDRVRGVIREGPAT